MVRGLLLLLLLILLLCAAMCAATCYACGLARAGATGGAGTEPTPKEIALATPVSPRRIVWPPAPVVPRITDIGRACARAAVRRGEFGPLSARTLSQIAAEAKRVTKGSPAATRATSEAIASVVRTEVTLAAQRVRSRETVTFDSMGIKTPASATAVLAAARSARVPPIAMLRSLLEREGLRASQIRSVLADPQSAATVTDLLTGDFTLLAEADLSSRANSVRAQEQAMRFEERVSEILTAAVGRGAYQRENDRRGDSAESSLTPDFLFKTPVMINGHIINWLDAKNYYWYGSPLTARSVYRQAEKYTQAFGPGAFVFRHGADSRVGIGAEATDIPPVMLFL